MSEMGAAQLKKRTLISFSSSAQSMKNALRFVNPKFKRSPIEDNSWLVVWNMNFIFPDIGNFIIPTDELIFFRGVGIPPTRSKYGW